MSTCISRHGEYGSHLPGEDRFICDRCFVFDEDAAMAALVTTESQLAAAQAQLAEAVGALDGVRAMHPPKSVDRKLASLRHWLAALSAAPQPESVPWDQPLPAMTPEEFRREHEGRWEQPEPPASDEPARCKGFSWIGQSFAHCDECGKPYWEHTHDRQHRPGAALFAADSQILVPITPEQAAACKRRWCPTCSGPSRETVGMVCQACGTDYGPGPAASGTPDGGS